MRNYIILFVLAVLYNTTIAQNNEDRHYKVEAGFEIYNISLTELTLLNKQLLKEEEKFTVSYYRPLLPDIEKKSSKSKPSLITSLGVGMSLGFLTGAVVGENMGTYVAIGTAVGLIGYIAMSL